MQNITHDQLKQALPKNLRRKITPQLVDKINGIIVDPMIGESFRDNLLGFTEVMTGGKFKLSQYINAIKYVSYKLLGQSNINAWMATHPESWQRLVDEGNTKKDISSYVAAYNKTKLVNLIYEQTLVPTHILNAHLFQEALNAQATLMNHAKSEMVRTNAANSLLMHLKRPEAQKVELDIGFKEDESIQALRASTLALVEQQKKMLTAGHMNALEIAESELIIVEAVDAD